MSRWLIATGDFTPLGGMDRANHALASWAARHGIETHLVAHRVAPDLRGDGIVVHSVRRPLGSHLLGAPLLARAAAREARTLGPSTRVLINGGNAPIAAPTWIHYVHAAYAPEPALLGARLRAAVGRRYFLTREAAAVRRAPLVICNSGRTARDVQHRYGVAPSRTRIVYYGSAPEEFGAVPAAVRETARRALGLEPAATAAVFVGALGDRRKGFDVLFDAWRQLSRDPSWQVDLLVAGAGAEQGAWRRRAASAGLQGRIRFLGFRSDVETVLAAADVLVHPVRYEAYGLGVHEAVCRGIPAIVTATAGIAERYPPSLAGLLLSDPPTSAGLVPTLRAWYANRAAWAERIAPLSAELRNRTWDDMAADIAALLEGCGG